MDRDGRLKIVEFRTENRGVVAFRVSIRLDKGGSTLKNETYLQTSLGDLPNEARQ